MGLGDWQIKVAKYLLIQHAIPYSETNLSPAELLMGHRLRTTLDRLHPGYSLEKPLDSSKARGFSNGDLVYAQNFTGHLLWLPGKIIEVTGPRSYKVELYDD